MSARTSVICAALLAVTFTVGGCASVHSAYVTNLSVPASTGKPVAVTVEKTVVLGFNFNNDYVFTARDALLDACPAGRVTGVLSTYETFFYLLWTRHEIHAEGVCVPADAPAAAPAAPAPGDRAPAPGAPSAYAPGRQAPEARASARVGA